MSSPSLGFSDARFSVIKRGVGVAEQGRLCRELGSGVCPEVFQVFDDGYEMEMLDLPTSHTVDDLMEVLRILSNEVWTQKPRMDRGTDALFGEHDWLQPLLGWSMGFPWITEHIKNVYPTEPRDGYTMIHGDPTLANMMRTRRGRVRLADPMPRTKFRREIPDRPEVDLGKLLQSASGWELIMGKNREHGNEVIPYMRAMENSLPREDMVPAFLWASIHLARLSYHAKQKELNSVERWATMNSKKFVEVLGLIR